MTTDSRHTDSQKLVKCVLLNKNKQPATRFVELESYKLWSYMICSKHGFEIQDIYLALWVTSEEFARKQMLYTHSGQVEKMNRIAMMLYDDANNFALTMNRYVLEPETELLKKVLTSHVRDELVINNSFEMRVVTGVCISNQKKLDKILLGLTSDQIY
ncbi:MAG: hypothetical protein A2521_09015 [Deltaproteobacteria bacterium RIFOXYD12_FULL_57_12]|nr:MAG: hypothetical protein A2521_09015 [Deltaproteobacteria bacterium RIFOXYD12_FULL_57_12]